MMLKPTPKYIVIYLKKETVKELYYLTEKYNSRIRFLAGLKTFVNRLDTEIKELEIEIDSDIDTFLSNTKITQCVILTNDFETIKKIKAEVLEYDDNIKIVNQSKKLVEPDFIKEEYPRYFIDVTNDTISKGNGIRKLCEYLNIDTENTISIGDDINDLSMFEITSLSIAMGNSPEKVKEKAKIQNINK